MTEKNFFLWMDESMDGGTNKNGSKSLFGVFFSETKKVQRSEIYGNCLNK
jgi:hypothetical protein